MQYALLIYQPEEVMEHWSEADLKEALTRHGSLQEKVKAIEQKFQDAAE